MDRKDLSIVRSDTYIFDVVAKRPDPDTGSLVPIDLTTGKAWFTAKRTLNDLDANAVIQLSTTTSGVILLAAPLGIVRVTIPPLATTSLPNDPVALQYDIQVSDAAGVVTTIQKGLLMVEPDVTLTTP